MARVVRWIAAGLTRQSLEHIGRTVIAATVSFLVARRLSLPEAYWATITAMIVMQSTLGAALTVSIQRLVGTALGASVGALLAVPFGSSLVAFAAGLIAMGFICAALHLDRAAYRFAGITLTVVMLVTSVRTPWVTASHRFIEVSVGIAVGLLLTAAWPERAVAEKAGAAPAGGRS